MPKERLYTEAAGHSAREPAAQGAYRRLRGGSGALGRGGAAPRAASAGVGSVLRAHRRRVARQGRRRCRRRGAVKRAALGASGAAAADDGYTGLFGRCVGSLIETVTAARAEGLANEHMAGHTGELMLLKLREMYADPAGALEGETGLFIGEFEVVANTCFLADTSAAMLAARRNGNKAAYDELQERWDEKQREIDEKRERLWWGQ